MKPIKTYTVEEATKVMEHYCAYQERCHKEVASKLNQLRMIPEAQEQIILHLLQHNFLNEERFAKTFARSKFNQNKWGKIKITQQLKFREISAYNIKNALLEIKDEDYINAINTLIKKKSKSIADINVFKKKQKIVQYLYAKGYETDLVYKQINTIIKKSL